MIQKISDRETWLRERMNGIGGSDAAAVLGKSPFKTNIKLWKEKTGIETPEDISDKDYVQFGKKAEQHIRGLFEIAHAGEFAVDYSEFDIHRNNRYPFIFATLDGILTDSAGRKGVLEIKTTTIRRSSDWKKWNDDKVPDYYYIQMLHQLLATEFDYAVMFALLEYETLGDKFPRYQIIERRMQRRDVNDDMIYLLKKECEFQSYVERKVEPPMILPMI